MLATARRQDLDQALSGDEAGSLTCGIDSSRLRLGRHLELVVDDLDMISSCLSGMNGWRHSATRLVALG